MLTSSRSMRVSPLVLTLLLAGCGGGSLMPAGAGGDATRLTGFAGGRAGISGVAGIGGGYGGGSGAASGGTGGNCSFSGTGIGGYQINCPGLCGNGRRETCPSYEPGRRCTDAPPFIESCDGADLGSKDCTTFGYVTGELACGPNCTFDTTACSDCVPLGANLASCGDAPVHFIPAGLAIAGNDREIALAWSEIDPGTGLNILGFARLSPTLVLLSSSRIVEPALHADQGSGMVAVAPLPSGWVVAASGGDTIFTHAFSATGADLGGMTVATNAAGALSSFYLVGRPGGGPLIAWETVGGSPGDQLNVAVVGDDGRSVSLPGVLPLDSYYGLRNVVSAAGAFYALLPVAGVDDAIHLRIYRIETDGTPGSSFDLLPGIRTNSPMLVADANDLRVIYEDITSGDPTTPDSGLFVQKLDSNGAAVGPRARVGGANAPSYILATTPIALGADTVALLLGVTADNALGLTRLAADGTPITPPFPIARIVQAYTPAVMARRGPEIVVVWATGWNGRIRLARATP
jgi:hypothetical protein